MASGISATDVAFLLATIGLWSSLLSYRSSVVLPYAQQIEAYLHRCGMNPAHVASWPENSRTLCTFCSAR